MHSLNLSFKELCGGGVGFADNKLEALKMYLDQSHMTLSLDPCSNLVDMISL